MHFLLSHHVLIIRKQVFLHLYKLLIPKVCGLFHIFQKFSFRFAVVAVVILYVAFVVFTISFCYFTVLSQFMATRAHTMS